MHLLAEHYDSAQIRKQYFVFFFSNEIFFIQWLLNLVYDEVHIVDVRFLCVDPLLNSLVSIEGIFRKFFPVLDYFVYFEANHDALKDCCRKFTIEIERFRANWFLCLLHC